MTDPQIPEAFTFDDVLLVPGASEVLPHEVDVQTQLTREITLDTPLISAAMDTVTEHETAICMAQNGGIGIIHKNLPVADQAAEADKVKRSESGMIVDPITMRPEQYIYEALEVMARYRISGVPITREGKAVGILTHRDLRFVRDTRQEISRVMTKANLVTVPPGTDMERAKELLHEYRIEKLLVVDDDGHLRGLITIKDIEKSERFPHASKDALGRLRCSAAVGVGVDCLERAQALVDAGVDVIVVDTAHGHSRGVSDRIEELRRMFPDLPLIGGNVATGEGVEALIKAGVSGVKIGVGPGSICTTRVVAGVGVPQLTAILECARVASRAGVPAIRRGALRGGPVPGTLLQGLPGHGLIGRHGGRQRRPLLPVRADRSEQAGAGGHRGADPLPGQPHQQHSPARGRPALGHGLCRRSGPRAPAGARALRARVRGGHAGKPRPRRDHHEGSSELSDRVNSFAPARPPDGSGLRSSSRPARPQPGWTTPHDHGPPDP
jgi:IMP dehydrogenase